MSTLRKNSDNSSIQKKNCSSIKIPENMVYASYLPQDITEEKLKSIFGEIGQVKEVTIKSKMDGFTFAYVTYFSEKDASTALVKLKNKKIDSNFIRVKPFQTNHQPAQKKKPEQHRVKMEDGNSSQKFPDLTQILERCSRSSSPPDFGMKTPFSSIDVKDSFMEKRYSKPCQQNKHKKALQTMQMMPFNLMGASTPMIGYIPIIYFPQFQIPSQKFSKDKKKKL